MHIPGVPVGDALWISYSFFFGFISLCSLLGLRGVIELEDIQEWFRSDMSILPSWGSFA